MSIIIILSRAISFHSRGRVGMGSIVAMWDWVLVDQEDEQDLEEEEGGGGGVEENEARETAKATEGDQPEDWG